MDNRKPEVTEALEGHVRHAERLAAMLGTWAAYDLAYTAYAAWVMGEDPLAALSEAMDALPDGLHAEDAQALRRLASSIESAVTKALE